MQGSSRNTGSSCASVGCLRGKDGSGKLYKLNEKSLLPCKCLMNAQVSSLHHLGARLCVTEPWQVLAGVSAIVHMANTGFLKSISCPHQCSKLELLELSFSDQALIGA